MSSATRGTAAVVGLLFLSATVSFFTGETLITGVIDRPDGLTRLSADTLSAGALLAFVDGLAVVGIAVLMFPLLKSTSESLALGYIGLRVTEFAAILLFLAGPLVAAMLARGATDASSLQQLGPMLHAEHSMALRLIYLFNGVSGALFAALLYRSALIPRWMAVLGLIGYPVLFVGTVFDMFGVIDLTQGAGLVALVPGGLFELILPIWLIARGFARSGQRAARTPVSPAWK